MNPINKQDGAKHQASWSVRKFASQADYEAGKAYEEVDLGNNEMANAGLNVMTTLLCGGGGADFSAPYIGVGDSDDVFDATDTDLQAAVNKLRVDMDDTYPTYGTDQKVTFRSTFASDEANYVWKEFGVFTAGVAGTMLNRKVSNQGTKTAGQVWEVTVEITFS